MFKLVKKVFFSRINNFIRFYTCKFSIECNSIELYFNEKSRM